MHCSVGVKSLGQVGYRLDFGGLIVYVDPYLSDSVREQEGDDLERLQPIPLHPDRVTDAELVFITHSHRDHCDAETLVPLAQASPKCRFMGPSPVRNALSDWGIELSRILASRGDRRTTISNELSVIATPAAHPQVELDRHGEWLCVGYLFEWRGKRIYHAGDTSLSDELVGFLGKAGKIDYAFIPVNEKNYFRDRRGIIGNMSVREAFGLASELGVGCVIPTHWDMFAANQVYEEEIELLYKKLSPPFELCMKPAYLGTTGCH